MRIQEAVAEGLNHNHKAKKRVLARKMSKEIVTCTTFEHVFTRIFSEAQDED